MAGSPTASHSLEGPASPTRRGPVAALLVGSAVLFAVLMVLDLYGRLPPDLTTPFAAFGPPAAVILVIAVLLEGLAGSYLAATSRHPLDAPFITHYGTRALAAGGTLVAAGILAYIVWLTAARELLAEEALLMELAIMVTVVGGAVLLSAIGVLASAIVTPWVTRGDG